MDPIISTPRLKLTLVTKAGRGSQELEWVHRLRSDEKATWWSIHGRSKSLEDTEKVMQAILPTAMDEDGKERGEREGEEKHREKSYRVAYAVHRVSDSAEESEPSAPEQRRHCSSTGFEFIGMVTLKSLDAGTLALPDHLTVPVTGENTATLIVELSYSFLPGAWGAGYATESLEAVFEACRRARSFWSPFDKVYVRAIVNEGNPASRRVMDKSGMVERGVYELVGVPIFLAGEMRERHSLHIYGMYLDLVD